MKSHLYNAIAFLLLLVIFQACTGEKNQSAEASPTVEQDSGLPDTLFTVDADGNHFSLSHYPYTHHRANGGKTPVPGDRVSYHETIYQNDSVIYSTRLLNRPIISVLPPLDKLPRPIPPDYEGLLLMAVGDSLSVVQDLDTFDIQALPPGITNDDQFIYHISLEEIVPREIVEKEVAKLKAREQSVADTVHALISDFTNGKLDGKLQTDSSGIKYLLYEKGTGREANSGNFVRVHYSGFLKDSTNFDNTFKDAQPFTFRLDRGRVIKGWDIGVDLMSVGGKGVFFIPYGLGYGVAGKPPNIPQKADLVFYIEVLEVY